MRIENLAGDDAIRPLGALVVAQDGAEIVVDAGPADGPPFVRIRLSRTEALELSSNLRAVANGHGEEILLSEG